MLRIGALLAGVYLITTTHLFGQHTVQVQRPGLGEYIWGIESPDTGSCWGVAWAGIENFTTAWVMRTIDGGASWVDVTPAVFDSIFVEGFHAPNRDTAFACV
ncbi:MAG: hypothetical protein WBG80_13210, partial [Bacteroidota bacterium]